MRKITRFNRTNTNDLLVDESIFALQNGLIGVRGNFTEGYSNLDYKQTLINGFYNYYDYKYEENSPAFPQKGQRIINVIDGQTIEFSVNNININAENYKLTNLEREFDLEKGISTRIAKYESNEGFIFKIYEERLVSFIQKELLIIKIRISSPNYSGKINVVSKLQLPNKINSKRMDSRINVAICDQLTISSSNIKESVATLLTETTKSELQLATGITHNKHLKYSVDERGIYGFIQDELSKDKSFEIIKYVVYTPKFNSDSVLDTNQTIINKVSKNGYEYYLEKQHKYLDDFWSNASIDIIGNTKLNNMVQYNIYQLNACANNNSRFNIPAKGLTGEGYEGHYFWDTEIYMIPFFTITNPEIAKSLLLNRYKNFDKAKLEAKKLGSETGVKIPWRTINGDEASPYFLAGSAQYHINSDIAYAVIKYYEYTLDFDFMVNYGFEMLLETARFLYNIGNFYNGAFHINNVTGPDEYTVIANDNYYTNSMAKYHFEKLVEFYNIYQESLDKTKELSQEINKISQAAKLMKLCYDDELKIFPQDDAFLQKKPIDFTKIPKEKFPLILHYHPLFIYQHQILKQADVLLSLLLLDYNNLEIFNRNLDYYLPLTTHDSSLSKCIHSIIAFRLNKPDLGYKYLQDIAKVDLENTHQNTDQGLHIANSGGIYLAMTSGVLGLRIKPDYLVIRPKLPKQLEAIKYKLNYKNNKIQIELKEKISIMVEKPIKLGIYNDIVEITDYYQCDYK